MYEEQKVDVAEVKERDENRGEEKEGLTDQREVDNRRTWARSQSREKRRTKEARAGERFFCAYCSTSIITPKPFWWYMNITTTLNNFVLSGHCCFGLCPPIYAFIAGNAPFILLYTSRHGYKHLQNDKKKHHKNLWLETNQKSWKANYP